MEGDRQAGSLSSPLAVYQPSLEIVFLSPSQQPQGAEVSLGASPTNSLSPGIPWALLASTVLRFASSRRGSRDSKLCNCPLVGLHVGSGDGLWGRPWASAPDPGDQGLPTEPGLPDSNSQLRV